MRCYFLETFQEQKGRKSWIAKDKQIYVPWDENARTLIQQYLIRKWSIYIIHCKVLRYIFWQVNDTTCFFFFFHSVFLGHKHVIWSNVSKPANEQLADSFTSKLRLAFRKPVDRLPHVFGAFLMTTRPKVSCTVALAAVTGILPFQLNAVTIVFTRFVLTWVL